MSQEYLNKVFDKLFPTTEAFKQKKIASVSKSGVSTSNFTSPFPKIKESEIRKNIHILEFVIFFQLLF